MISVGVVGLGLKNPYTYAPILAGMGAEVRYVWDYNPRNAEEFAKAFGCKVIEDLSGFPFRSVDAALVESRNCDHCTHADLILSNGIPVFVEKPLSNNCDEALSFLRRHEGDPFFSCSPLRLSGTYKSMAERGHQDCKEHISLCRVTVLHTMEHFLSNPDKAWHDRVTEGGGMFVDIGIHAVELLNMFMKGLPLRISHHSVKSFYKKAESDDLHTVVLTYADHSIGEISLLCATSELDYSVEIYTPRSSLINSRSNKFLDNDDRPENAYGGFVGTMRGLLSIINSGIPPIDPKETERNFSLLKMILSAQ